MTPPERTVLLVSSSLGRADVYRDMLRQAACYRVIETPEAGSMADQPTDATPVDAILLEIQLGDRVGQGLDRLTQLKRQWGSTCPPVIVVGSDDVKTAVAALKAGAADYRVGDRLTPEELCSALHNAIAERILVPSQLPNASRIVPAALPPPDSAPDAADSAPPEKTAVQPHLPDHQALMAALPQIVWAADSTGAVTYWNQHWYDYTGLSAAESMGLAGAVCVHSHEYALTLDRWTEAIAVGQTFEIEHRLRRHDGLYRWFINRGVPTRDGTGQITGWVGTVTDIDEQKRLEDRFRLVIQAVDGLVFDVTEVSLNGDDCVHRSEQLFDLIGVPADEAPPTSRWWEARIHPEDRPRLRRRMQALWASSETLHESQYRIRHAEGHWVDVWERARLVRDDQGQVTRMVGSIVDISQQQQALRDRNRAELRLKEAHIQLEAALAAGSVYTWRWSIPDNRVVANRSFAQLFGLDPERVAAGVRLEKFIALIHPDDRERVTVAINQAIATGDGCATEFRIGRVGGETRWVIARGRVEYDSEGKAVAFPGALADISDRKRTEAALQQKIQEVEASQQTLQALMEYIPEGINIASAPDVTIHQISRYGQQLVGRTLDELSGVPYAEHPRAWQVFCPDGTLAPPEALPLTRAVRQGEVVTNEEWLLQTAAGKTITILCNAGPIYSQAGDITGGILAWRDITELKQTENMLRRNQEHLSLAMAAAKMGSWDWDIQTNAVHFSDTVYHLFGLDPEQFEGSYETVLALVHPDDLARVQQTLHRAVYEQAEYNIELRVMKPNGDLCWILSLGRVFHGATGEPLHMTGIDIDITHRKQSELMLQQTTERLNVALKSAPITLFNHDLDLRYTWIYNPTHNYSIDEIIGRRDEDLMTPETAARLTRLKQQVMDTGVGLREEVEVTANGQTTYYDLTIDPIRDDQSAVVGVTCAAVDISERIRMEAERQQVTTALRESEDRLRMAIESAQMGTWDWNLVTNSLAWDAGCKAIFGLPPDADSSIERFFESLHGDDRDRLQQLVQKVQVASSGGNFDAEYRVIGYQDGRERWVKAKGQVYFDQDGTPLRFIGTVLDITQQKQAEAARDRLLQREQAAREAAERANRIKDEFLAILSHELRSPLNPILGWAKLLQTKQLDADKTARALATIERNAKLQTQLIDDLLDIAKILRGKLRIETTPVDPVFVVEAAIETVQAAAEAKAIRLRADLPDIGLIQGDGGRIQQIVWNLMTNAVKFTPEQGQINVQLRQVDHWAELTVADSGRGIQPEFLPHIFDSFRQEDTSVTRQFGGLGLGLAIVRYLVEAHGGTIAVASPGEGLGTTFRVQLPLLSNRLLPRAEPPTCPDAIDLTGVRVIALDDNADALALLTLLLEQYGAEVRGLDSAAAVLPTLATFNPHVLVSDIGMPDLDGYELMQQIRALPPELGGQVAAIALTAYVRDEDAQKALDSGFQRHLPKPVEPEVIGLAVAELAKQ